MSSKKVAKGKRYSEAEKQEVVDFVTNYNNEKGRGGQSAAAEKYKVSQLTVSTWLKKSGAPKLPTSRAAKAASKKPIKGSKSVAAPTAKSSGDFSSKLSALVALDSQIAKAEKELAGLKSKFASLKASL